MYRQHLIVVVILWHAGQASSVLAQTPTATIQGKVVQVTATSVYLDLGLLHGLKNGDTVIVSGSKKTETPCVVVDVWQQGSRAQFSENAHIPVVGTPVTALVNAVAIPPQTSTAPQPIPRPESRAHLAQRWQGVDKQRTERIVYRGSATAAPATTPTQPWIQGTLRAEYLGLFNLGASTQPHFHQAALYSALDVNQLYVSWLNYSHRLRLRFQAATNLDSRRFQSSRTVPLVYQLRVGANYGRWNAFVGRSMAAPLPTTTLTDGAGVRAQVVDGLYLGAYGGGVPRTTDLAPTFDSVGYGTYASWRSPSTLAQAEDLYITTDLGFVGTMYQGANDRQSLVLRATTNWKALWLYAHATVDFYPTNHPSGLSTDLGTLATEVAFNPIDSVRLSARYDRYRFVPSRENFQLFPTEYISLSALHSTRGSVAVDFPAALTIDIQGGWDYQDATSRVLWGDVTLRRLGVFADVDQLLLAVQLYNGSLLDGYGGRLGYYAPLLAWLAISASYNLTHDEDYLANTTWRHLASLGCEVTLGRHWLFTLDGATQLSDDERMLQLFGTTAWVF